MMIGLLGFNAEYSSLVKYEPLIAMGTTAGFEKILFGSTVNLSESDKALIRDKEHEKREYEINRGSITPTKGSFNRRASSIMDNNFRKRNNGRSSFLR